MKKWTMILVVMAYAVAVLAIIEGICKQMYITGIVASLAMVWLGSKLKQEADDYDTESN